MLLARTLLVAASALIVCSCHRLSSSDARVVGTWQFQSYGHPKRVRLGGDHKAVVLQYVRDDDTKVEFNPISAGTWRLDGSVLTVDVDFISIETDVPKI